MFVMLAAGSAFLLLTTQEIYHDQGALLEMTDFRTQQ
jgi:hypothetical protein